MTEHCSPNRMPSKNTLEKQTPHADPFEIMSDHEILANIARMNIVLLGIPGVGKTTLSKELAKRNPDIDYISLGDISRNLAPGSTEQLYLEQLFKGEAPTGDPDFFLQLIEGRVDAAKQHGRGFILDGIPKKSSEVQPLLDFLAAKDLKIDAVISCEASPLETHNRIAAREERPGDEDSMAVFLNRTKTYLTDISDFKDRLTADGACLFTLDTELLNERQSVGNLLDLTRIALSKQHDTSQSMKAPENSKSVESTARSILESLSKIDSDDISRRCEIAAILSSRLLGVDLSQEDTDAFIQYTKTNDASTLLSIAEKFPEHPLLSQHYPLTNLRTTNNLIASGLQPLLHLSDSLIEEVSLSAEPPDVAVARLVQLQVACADLLGNKGGANNLATLTELELSRNCEALQSLERIAYKEGIHLDAKYLMKIQPAVFEMLTSNDPVSTVDVNYRKRLNSRASAARSLQAPERPNPDKLVSRYGDYIDFIEATAATKRGGYASTFGFLHKVCTDDDGNPFIIEYPHSMFEAEILEVNHPIVDKLMHFEEDFQRTHDMLHNALPVYADHFMIHHPTAPITLGGYLPDYASFGKGMRKDKSSYEIALAILHKQIMQDRFEQEPALLDKHLSTVTAILDDLIDMQQREVCSDKIIDHVSFVIMTAAMNVLPYNSQGYQTLLDKYDKIDLPDLEVHPTDVYKLLIQQEVVPTDISFSATDCLGMSKDEIINHLCKNINDTTAIANLRDIELDYASAEQGAEHIVNALGEIGLGPKNLASPITLQSRERLRWISITASSRRLKGFNEKIHGLEAVRFWDEDQDQFRDVTPVSLLGNFHDHFKQNTDEYEFRIWFRGLSNTTLKAFKDVAVQYNEISEIGNAALSEIAGAIDYCIHKLLDDDYQPLSEAMRHQVKQLDAAANSPASRRLIECFLAYETLTQEAVQAATRNGMDFKEARMQLTRKLMSLNG